jgi:hypothetical protein
LHASPNIGYLLSCLGHICHQTVVSGWEH